VKRDVSLSQTEKEAIVLARRGQGRFRSNVLLIEKACRITGITNPTLLVASHIKPWRSCETALERLDGHNGLALAQHVDFLFDRGLLTFSDCGQLIISPRLLQGDRELVSLQNPKQAMNFSDKQKSYLQHHRQNTLLP